MTDIDEALARVQETHDAYTAARRADTEAQRRRDQAIRQAHKLGASYAEIADVIGVHRSYIYQLVKGKKK